MEIVSDCPDRSGMLVAVSAGGSVVSPVAVAVDEINIAPSIATAAPPATARRVPIVPIRSSIPLRSLDLVRSTRYAY